MQAYKVKGKIDQTGHLIITEPIELVPGDVEVILLQAPSSSEPVIEPAQRQESSNQQHISPIRAFQGLFENAPPIPPNFDPDQAKWDYLREKHNL